MELNYGQITKITFGAVEILTEPDGMHFHKCTEKQRLAWDSVSKDMGMRARTTTGVTLDFHTDSSFVTFTLSGGKFDLLVDGTLVQHLVPTEDSEELQLTQCLSEGEHRLTLSFPSHSTGILKAVALDDGAYIKPHSFDCKMLFLGDSITQGWNSEFDSLSYAKRTAAYFNAEAVINGIGGAVFVPESFDRIGLDPDLVFVAYGANDYWYYNSINDFSQNMREYLKLVKQAYSEKRVFVILPIPRFDLENEVSDKKLEAIRSEILTAARELDFKIIDGCKAVPRLPEFYADAVHPNALGFSLYSEYIIKAVNNSL